MFTITDTITGQSATVDAYDVIDTITGWYPTDVPEVTEAIAELEYALRVQQSGRPADSDTPAIFLALDVEVAE